MLLRTSSAPLAQTLLLTNPIKDHFDSTSTTKNRQPPSNSHEQHYSTKISFIHGLHHLNNSFSSSTSFPSYPSTSSIPELSPKGISGIHWKTFRKAQSDSNLESLAFDDSITTMMSESNLDMDENQTLRTEPSFCIYSSEDKFGEANDLIENEGKVDRSVATISDGIETDQFSFGMHMIKEDDRENEAVEEKQRGLNRFKDLEIDVQDEDIGIGGGGGGDFGFGMSKFNDNGDLDEHYDRIIRENPSSSLVLRNYAQYLESKGDLFGAEENYFRATLADPKDGEILSRYANLVWQLHRDYGQASSYFERAVQAAPEDSHIHAAYASFLWEIDEDEEEDNLLNTEAENAVKKNMDAEARKRPSSPPMYLAMGPGIDMAGFGRGDNADPANAVPNESPTVDEYYRKMVEENPCNPLILRNYALFLHQSKGDLHRAEDYYSRAILMEPSDGPTLSQYADLVWQLHHDRDRAAAYFEQAVQVSPNDSSVLGSYAKFLWETEDEKDDVTEAAHNQIPSY